MRKPKVFIILYKSIVEHVGLMCSYTVEHEAEKVEGVDFGATLTDSNNTLKPF